MYGTPRSVNKVSTKYRINSSDPLELRSQLSQLLHEKRITHLLGLLEISCRSLCLAVIVVEHVIIIEVALSTPHAVTETDELRSD